MNKKHREKIKLSHLWDKEYEAPLRIMKIPAFTNHGIDSLKKKRKNYYCLNKLAAIARENSAANLRLFNLKRVKSVDFHQ